MFNQIDDASVHRIFRLWFTSLSDELLQQAEEAKQHADFTNALLFSYLAAAINRADGEKLIEKVAAHAR